MWAGQVRGRRVEVDGIGLFVPPGVLDPVLFGGAAWFARQVAMRARGRLLDLGCGSGVVGLLARRAGAEVTACDVSPRAVAAARDNGLPDVRLGDLFAPVNGECFDVVAFNPPWYPGDARWHPLGRALFAGIDFGVIRRFAADVTAHIAPGGEALVLLGGRAPGARSALGDGWEVVAEEPVGCEAMAVLRRNR